MLTTPVERGRWYLQVFRVGFDDSFSFRSFSIPFLTSHQNYPFRDSSVITCLLYLPAKGISDTP